MYGHRTRDARKNVVGSQSSTCADQKWRAGRVFASFAVLYVLLGMPALAVVVVYLLGLVPEVHSQKTLVRVYLAVGVMVRPPLIVYLITGVVKPRRPHGRWLAYLRHFGGVADFLASWKIADAPKCLSPIAEDE